FCVNSAIDLFSSKISRGLFFAQFSTTPSSLRRCCRKFDKLPDLSGDDLIVSQLKSQNAIDKLDEVLAETPKVRKDLGYPPLVTPMSQMVGVQAAANVLAGERYKNISKEIKSYLKGEYGCAPGVVDADLQKKVLGDEQPITGRFADTLEPAFEKIKAEIGALARNDEDVLSYIAFPQIAEKFFKDREERESRIVSYTITRK
ncbi:MAG: hypothetical protein HGA25_11365, partial [Clostridiales bacterium]|nr:hypothetical protein [Clostridiales bacterium]